MDIWTLSLDRRSPPQASILKAMTIDEGKTSAAQSQGVDGLRQPRTQRFESHALIEVRRFKHLPFAVHSAVLLDISLGGFKFEFTGEVTKHPGEQFWIHIPLVPLGISIPSRFVSRGECRWFDGKRFRVGGIFTDLSRTEQIIVEQIIETLQERGAIPL